MNTSKLPIDFKKAPVFDILGQLGRHAPLDLMGPKPSRFTSPIEQKEAAAAVRRLWERVRDQGAAVVFPTREYIRRDWNEADFLVTIDSLGMHEDTPKRLLSLSRTPQGNSARPVFKLAFDPQAAIQDNHD